MNFKRGLIAGMIGTVAGALIPVVLIGGYTLLFWYWYDSPAMDRQADLQHWQKYGSGPIIGLAIYLGLSAWATYTPSGKHRFAYTLGILFLSSVPLMIVIDQLRGPPPPGRSGYEHQTDWFEVSIFLVSLLAVACLIILFRWFSSRKPEDTSQLPNPHT
ncbi:hypothetical protein Pan153_49760 [Gimesia panareensis]|uniref:Uncharacterized protein n=1 Tax=Gimesia panareensis TaxID=2527978 RepID=A0A518FVB0_9PLAN|nr:hypothetical protein [Gimesia panareensis]QDV20301.1 hypothetical protein Pan153_49760 [Gimesia panareensis]